MKEFGKTHLYDARELADVGVSMVRGQRRCRLTVFVYSVPPVRVSVLGQSDARLNTSG